MICTKSHRNPTSFIGWGWPKDPIHQAKSAKSSQVTCSTLRVSEAPAGWAAGPVRQIVPGILVKLEWWLVVVVMRMMMVVVVVVVILSCNDMETPFGRHLPRVFSSSLWVSYRVSGLQHCCSFITRAQNPQDWDTPDCRFPLTPRLCSRLLVIW